MRHKIKYLVLLLLVSPNLVYACKCIDWDVNDINMHAELIFVFETSGEIVVENEVRYFSGTVIESMKGKLKNGDQSLLDYFAGSSCAIPEGLKTKILIAAGYNMYGYPFASLCDARVIAPTYLDNGELVKPADKNIKILNDLRKLTHNNSLQSDARKSPRAAELKRYVSK